MRTEIEIKDELKYQENHLANIQMRKEFYLNEQNEFGFNLMKDKILEIESKIECLKFVLGFGD